MVSKWAVCGSSDQSLAELDHEPENDSSQEEGHKNNSRSHGVWCVTRFRSELGCCRLCQTLSVMFLKIHCCDRLPLQSLRVGTILSSSEGMSRHWLLFTWSRVSRCGKQIYREMKHLKNNMLWINLTLHVSLFKHELTLNNIHLFILVNVHFSVWYI